MRDNLDYTERRAGRAAEGSLTDEPQEGFYRIKRGGGSVWRPVRIWFGPPTDPDTGDELDRHWRWQALFCGRPIWDMLLVWPIAGKEPIDQGEYDYLLARIAHAKEHDPLDPFGTASGRVDWLTAPPPF